MKKVILGAVVGAVLVLAVGGAVYLGTQLDGGADAQKESSEPQQSSPSSEPQVSNEKERRAFLRTCRKEFDTQGELDCQCVVTEIEAQAIDPSALTELSYIEEAQNESIIRGCLQNF